MRVSGRWDGLIRLAGMPPSTRSMWPSGQRRRDFSRAAEAMAAQRRCLTLRNVFGNEFKPSVQSCAQGSDSMAIVRYRATMGAITRGRRVRRHDLRQGWHGRLLRWVPPHILTLSATAPMDLVAPRSICTAASPCVAFPLISRAASRRHIALAATGGIIHDRLVPPRTSPRRQSGAARGRG